MPTINNKPISDRDKEMLLAAAIGIDRYRMEDVYDTFVIYRLTDPVTRYYQRTYQIAADGTVTLGAATQVVRQTIYTPIANPATFSLPAESTADTADAGIVLRRGKLFEAGEYPDKQFSITEEELDAAVTAFTPVPNDLEHTPTILSGKLGEVRSVERVGNELFGVVAVPKWLDDITKTEPIKTSLTWARDTKQIVGNALVLNPRIQDAQLQAAFTAANTPKGESKTMTLLDKFKAMFASGKKPDEISEEDLAAVFKGDDTHTKTDPPAAPAAAAAKPTPDALPVPVTFSGTDLRLLQMEAERYIDGEIKAGRVFPAERPYLVAAFTAAAQADARAANTALFSAADSSLVSGDSITALKASIAARPALKLTQEQLAGNDLVIMSAPPKAGEMSDERRRELLGATPAGRRILEHKEN